MRLNRRKMSDPFVPGNSESQLIREAKIGFTIVLFVSCTLGYWGWVQYQRVRQSIPEHVRNAPVARHVGPDEYLSHLTPSPSDEIGVAASAPHTAPSESSLLGSINNNIDQINEIASSISSPGKSTMDQPKSPPEKHQLTNADAVAIQRPDDNGPGTDDFRPAAKPDRQGRPYVASVNPVAEPVARDISRELAPFDTLGKTVTKVSFNETDNRTAATLPKKPDSTESQQSKQIELPEDSSNVADAVTFEVDDNAPEMENPNEQHRIRDGDSYWSIAQQRYSDGGYFRALFEYNRDQIEEFENLPVGIIVRTPSPDILQSRYPELCPAVVDAESIPGQIYTTVSGDTLFGIARQTMGQASRYLELLNLNRDRLPANTNHLTRLPANVSLQLPMR